MNLAGVFAPLPTPFDDQDQFDATRLRAALSRWLATPLSGVVVLGSSGEAPLLADDECDRVVEVARSLVPSDRLLIAGTGRESTAAAVRAASRAAALGADLVLVRTPAAFKSQMTSDALVGHYTGVADRSPVPVLLYNFTALTGVNLLPAAVARLAEHPNIVGIKESGSDPAQVAELVVSTPADFRVLTGSGATFHSAMCAGVSGGILAVAGLRPRVCVRIYELARAQRYDEARSVQQRLTPLARAISTYGIPGLKAAYTLAGWDVGRPRPPLGPATDAAVAVIREALSIVEEVAA